jgi:hypothetical protein
MKRLPDSRPTTREGCRSCYLVGLLNNLAFAQGMRPVYPCGAFVGTVGEYTTAALKSETSPRGGEPGEPRGGEEARVRGGSWLRTSLHADKLRSGGVRAATVTLGKRG